MWLGLFGILHLGFAALTKVKVLALWDNFAIVRQLMVKGDLTFSKLVVCAAPGA